MRKNFISNPLALALISLSLVCVPHLTAHAAGNPADFEWGNGASTESPVTGNITIDEALDFNFVSIGEKSIFRGGATLTGDDDATISNSSVNITKNVKLNGAYDFASGGINKNRIRLNILGAYATATNDTANSRNYTLNDNIVNISGSEIMATSTNKKDGGADTGLNISGGLVGIIGIGLTEAVNGNHILSDNTVIISNSTIKVSARDSTDLQAANMSIYGGAAYSDGDLKLTGNSIIIKDDSSLNVGGDGELSIIGGNAMGMDIDVGGNPISGTGKHTVTKNSVSISGAINVEGTGDTFGIYGGSSTTGGDSTISGNSVNIDGLTVAILEQRLNIAGGHSNDNTGSGSNTLKDNNVFIRNLTVDVENSVTIAGTVFYAPDANGITVENNNVSLSGEVNIESGDVIVLAGVVDGQAAEGAPPATGTYDTDEKLRKNNTITLDGATVRLNGTDDINTPYNFTSKVYNFKNYVFNPTYNQIINNIPMLTAHTIDLGDDANLSINDSAFGGGGGLIPSGHVFTLLEAEIGIIGDFANLADTYTIQQGISLQYNVIADLNGRFLSGTIIGVQGAQEQSKVPAKGQIAAVAVLNQGADLFSGAGIDNALAVTEKAAEEDIDASGSSSWLAFGAFGGGESRYEVGSHADISGINLVAGFARRSSFSAGNMLYGAFFEYGKSNIDVDADFSNQAKVTTDGDSEYYGGGIFTRFNHKSNAYAELSLRLGSSEVEQSSSNYAGLLGQDVSYDTSGMYYGAHLGLGYIHEINDAHAINVYGKYFYTYQEGDDANIAGDEFKFDEIISHRIRLGARYEFTIAKYISPYIGAAWEHEFDGDADYSVYGLSAGTPSIGGSTGVFEAGLAFKLLENSALSLDFGVEAYTGVREGISGKFQLSYEF